MDSKTPEQPDVAKLKNSRFNILVLGGIGLVGAGTTALENASIARAGVLTLVVGAIGAVIHERHIDS